MKTTDFLNNNILNERAPRGWHPNPEDVKRHRDGSFTVVFPDGIEKRFNSTSNYTNYRRSRGWMDYDDSLKQNQKTTDVSQQQATPKKSNTKSKTSSIDNQLPVVKTTPSDTGQGNAGVGRHPGETVERAFLNKSNQYYTNSQEEKAAISAYYTFPMIFDDAHINITDIGKTSKVLGSHNHDVKWYQQNVTKKDIQLTTDLQRSMGVITKNQIQKQIDDGQMQFNMHGYAVGLNVTAGGKKTINYLDRESLLKAIQTITALVEKNYGPTIIKSKDGKLIHWTQSGIGVPGALALTHNVVVDRKGEQIHFFQGFITNQINVNAETPSQTVNKYNLSGMRDAFGFYSGSARAKGNIGQLKPIDLLGMPKSEDDVLSWQDVASQVNILGEDVIGRKFDQPFVQIPQEIKKATGNDKKTEGLLGIYDQIINKKKLPVIMQDTIKANGYYTNSVTVDFCEILHPLIAMKNDPSIIRSNGLYSAARTFLGPNPDMANATVFYPGAGNQKLFDSALEITSKGKTYRLLISSKSGKGASPSTDGLKAALDELLKLKDLSSLASSFGTSLSKAKVYQQWINLLSTGAGPEQFRIPGANTIDKLSDKLNANTEFLEFCAWVLSNTNIVQINTEADENKEKTGGEIRGFVATWPTESTIRLQSFRKNQEWLNFLLV